MKHKLVVVLKALCLGVLLAASLPATTTLVLNPVGGALTGALGGTVGWGFTLSNSANFIEVTQSVFCLDAGPGPFNPCFSTSSRYTDIISTPPSDVILGPGGSLTQPWVVSSKGVGSFNIPIAAPVGLFASGNIVLTYTTFDADPNRGGNQLGGDLTVFAPASVTVTGTPEPATLGLVGLALAGLAIRRLPKRG